MEVLLCWLLRGCVYVLLNAGGQVCHFSVRNPPKEQEQTSVELPLLQAGKLCGSFGWKWAELQPFSCCLPCNLCSFPDSHLHCQKRASSHLLLAGLLLTGLLPSHQGKALPSAQSLQAAVLGCCLCFHPQTCTLSSDYSCLCFTRKPPHLSGGLVRVVRERGVFSYSNFGLKYRLLMTFSPEC